MDIKNAKNRVKTGKLRLKQDLGTYWQGLRTFRDITARNRGHIRNYGSKPMGLHAKSAGWIGSRESKAFEGLSAKLA
jgi:hypothetical protein